MSERARTVASVARGSVFLFSVCFLLPMILFKYLGAVLGGVTSGFAL